jgi:hypothetical protein
VFKALRDFVARNRRWIGGLGMALWTVAQGDQQLVAAHPRLMMYAGAVAAYVLASGIHKDDKFQQAKQDTQKRMDE